MSTRFCWCCPLVGEDAACVAWLLWPGYCQCLATAVRCSVRWHTLIHCHMQAIWCSAQHLILCSFLSNNSNLPMWTTSLLGWIQSVLLSWLLSIIYSFIHTFIFYSSLNSVLNNEKLKQYSLQWKKSPNLSTYKNGGVLKVKYYKHNYITSESGNEIVKIIHIQE